MPPCRARLRHRALGFTLVELVLVLVIVGVLAAIAVPRLLALGDDARRVRVQALAATLRETAEHVALKCRIQPGCGSTAGFSFLSWQGRSWRLVNGYPEAGDVIGGDQIDAMIPYSGFTASLPDNLTHRFALDGAPTPAQCAATYVQATALGDAPVVTTDTGGC